MKRRLEMLIVCSFACIASVFAQNVNVSGVVLSGDDGEPISGASIKIEGSKDGAITNMDGEFTFSKLPVDAKSIVVTFIGMQSAEVAIKSDMKIVLKHKEIKAFTSREAVDGDRDQLVKAERLTASADPAVIVAK